MNNFEKITKQLARSWFYGRFSTITTQLQLKTLLEEEGLWPFKDEADMLSKTNIPEETEKAGTTPTLTAKLSVADQRYFLSEIAGLILDPEDNRSIYDEEGDDIPWAFDLTTLGGIIQYAKHDANERGKADAKYDIRQALGL